MFDVDIILKYSKKLIGATSLQFTVSKRSSGPFIAVRLIISRPLPTQQTDTYLAMEPGAIILRTMNNKFINIVILLLLALFISFRLFTACNQMNNEPQAELNDTIDSPPAVFRGMIPCADCPGIDVYLLLEENNRFRELNWFRDRSPEPFVTEGTWTLQGDTLTLFSNEDNRLKTFLYKEESIIMLDSNLQQISGDMSSMYVLEKSREESSIRQRHEELRAEEDIRFLASGNEPFWSIRIDSKGTLHYITPQSEWSAPATRQNTGEELAVWTTSHENSILTLTAEKAWCRDTMSGFLFTHEVTVQYDSGGETEFRGCGRFLVGEY